MISKAFIEAKGDLVARVKCTLPTNIYTASDVVLATERCLIQQYTCHITD